MVSVCDALTPNLLPPNSPGVGRVKQTQGWRRKRNAAATGRVGALLGADGEELDEEESYRERMRLRRENDVSGAEVYFQPNQLRINMEDLDNLPDVDSDGEDLTAQNAIMRELREDYLRRKALADTPADSQFTNLEADSQTNDVHSVMSLIRRTNSTKPTANASAADDGDDDETAAAAAGSNKTAAGAAAAAAAAMAQPRSAFSALWGGGKENGGGGNGVAGAAPMLEPGAGLSCPAPAKTGQGLEGQTQNLRRLLHPTQPFR